jgi:hypothetical protein
MKGLATKFAAIAASLAGLAGFLALGIRLVQKEFHWIENMCRFL